MILYFKMATLAPCGVQKGMVEGSTECGIGGKTVVFGVRET